ncbi:MAG: hypothetical protein M3O65_16200, partial [Actinomycetota bacterium]|nr:hypothetical protein [Actinomycetota bacterium]
MPDWIRRRLTYANVMATVAVFIALGGSSYAALTITGRDVHNGSLTGKDLRRNTLGGTRIKESRLGRVPSAQRAVRLGGLTGRQLQQRCPAGTVHSTGACVERTARTPQPYSMAVNTCQTEAFKGFAEGAGRLPTWPELYRTVSRGGGPALTPPGELTADIADVRADGTVLAIVMTTPTGRSVLVPDSGMEDGARPYR